MAKKRKEIAWTREYVESLAPDAASIPAAEKVLTKGGFGTVESTTDGAGWWVVCQGITDKYQVSVLRDKVRPVCRCNCPSPKIPCKHALALLLHLVEHPELRVEAEAPKKSTADFESLLRAAFANPEDDIHRLVLADYLEENDQPDRAALIRLQCEQAHLKPSAKRYKELAHLIADTEARVRERLGAFPGAVQFTFHRGFMRLNGLHRGYGHILGSLPTRFTDLFRDGWVETLATHPFYALQRKVSSLVEHVGELDVSSEVLNDEQLTKIAAETAKFRAKGRLARVTVGAGNQTAFDNMVRFKRGEDVDLSADLGPVRQYYAVDAQLFRQLLQFGRFGKARDLFVSSSNLPSTRLGEKQITALLTADLSELRHLRLMYWDIDKGAMEALVNSPALAKLTTLSLESCGVRSPALNSLVRGALFATLKNIDLTGNAIGKHGVNALLKPDAPKALQKLTLAECDIDASDRKRLKAKYGAKLKV